MNFLCKHFSFWEHYVEKKLKQMADFFLGGNGKSTNIYASNQFNGPDPRFRSRVPVHAPRADPFCDAIVWNRLKR